MTKRCIRLKIILLFFSLNPVFPKVAQARFSTGLTCFPPPSRAVFSEGRRAEQRVPFNQGLV